MELFVALIILVFLTFGIVFSLLNLKDQADYFKMEIGRSFDIEEREHWERELAKLYLCKIPLLGKWIYKVYVRRKYNGR